LPSSKRGGGPLRKKAETPSKKKIGPPLKGGRKAQAAGTKERVPTGLLPT